MDRRRQCDGIAADARAEVDDQATSEPAGFVTGDGLGGCLFDADRVNPHAHAVLEFRRRLLAGQRQTNGGRDGLWRGVLPQTGQLGGPTDRGFPISSSRCWPAGVERTQASASAGLVKPTGPGSRWAIALLASCRNGARLRIGNADSCENSDREFKLKQNGECTAPAVPPIVRQPLSLGQVPIPTRFFLAPLAGYTSLAYRLAVRECGGLGSGHDGPGQCAVVARKAPASVRAVRDVRKRPPAFDPALRERHFRDGASRALGGREGSDGRRHQHGLPGAEGGQNRAAARRSCARWIAQSTWSSAVVRAVSIPVTVKMRLGWDDESLTAPELARAFEQAGVCGVIVHGRTRQQGFKGTVSRAGIRAVVEAVERIPVVANGDIRTIADAAATFEETGCAADLDRPRGAGQSLSVSPARLLEPDGRSRARSRLSTNGSS